MKTSLNYKCNLDQNVLRQVIFTDKNLLFALIIGSNLFLFLFFNDIQPNTRILIHFSTSLALILLSTSRLDGIYLPYLLPKIITFLLSNKKRRDI